MSRSEPMSTRRALALAACALDYVASETGDIPEWRQAAGVVRDLLSQERSGPVPDWTIYTRGGHQGQGPRGRGDPSAEF